MPLDTSKYPKDFGKLMAEYAREAEQLMSWLDKGLVDAAGWERAMKKLVAKYTQAARMLGEGTTELSEEATKTVSAALDFQYKHLKDFTTTIKSAPEFNPAWLSRAYMYGTSSTTQYWEGKTSGLPLPAQPAQGTQCLSNCRCSWDVRWLDKEKGDADCYWILDEAEHCQTCQVRADQWNPVRIRGWDFGPSIPGAEVPSPDLTGPEGSQGYTDYHSNGIGGSGDPAFDDLNSKYKDWYASLTTNEKKAIQQYTRTAYSDINEPLRSLRGSEVWDPRTYELDAALYRSKLPKDLMLHRGVTNEFMVESLNKGQLKVGKSFRDLGFASTSVNDEIMDNYKLGDETVLLNIRAKKGMRGAYLGNLSEYPYENEVLLPRRAEMKILSIKKVPIRPGSTRLVYELEVEYVEE